MLKFGFFLKTYRDDYIRAKRLIASWSKFNTEKLKLFLMCPDDDMELFAQLAGADIEIISENIIDTELFEEDKIWTKGYLNQEIFKLAFWETGLCENYQCIDSDAVFIRPFYLKDFMFDEDIPYTTLVEDKELKSDIYYNRLYWESRMKWLLKVEDALNFHPYKMLTCHGFQIFSSKVLKSFKEEYLDKNNYTYKDIIEIAPYEFSWYNFWLQKTEVIPIKVCEPNFKTFHLKQHHINSVLRGMKLEDWSKGYLGIILNSNFGVGSGDYYDLSVYNKNNCGLLPETIKASRDFYNNILSKRNGGIFKRIFNFLRKR